MIRLDTLPRRVALYAIAGAFIGTAWGAWSLSSRGASRATIAGNVAAAPSAPACPEGYAAAQGFDSSGVVDGTHVRWIVRCDPRVTDAALSESLELFYDPNVYLAPSVISAGLADFTRAVAVSGRVALDPVPTPTEGTLRGQRTYAFTVEGGFRLPALFSRAWLLPAGGSTVQVLLVGPRSRAAALEAAAAAAITRIEGLRAYDAAVTATRGFSVRAQCPAGFTDATPPNGGSAETAYVGRYCLQPGNDGGAELTFTEVSARAEDEAGARRMLELASTMISTVGLASDGGFATMERFPLTGMEGRTARMDAEPPAARVTLRAIATPSHQGTVYALALSMHDHGARDRERLESWLGASGLMRAYDGTLATSRKSEQFRGFVLLPGALTALLGAAIAYATRKKD